MNCGPVRTDASALWDWAPHDVGLICSLIDDLPVQVSCWSIASRDAKKDTEFCSFRLKFPSGINSISHVGWVSPIKKRSLTVVASNKVIIFDDTDKHKLTLFSSLHKKRNVEYIASNSISPLAQEVESFVSCIRQKKNPITDFIYGSKVIKIIESLESSLSQDGKLVEI
jgi:UDP-2-acetamido-3-amino-2,3-dideoxy-glucuronate N-acetyltransferase